MGGGAGFLHLRKRKQAVAPARSICCTRLLLAISHLRLFGLGSGAGPGRRSSTAASDDRNLTQTRTDCQRLSCVLLSISFGPTGKKSAYRPFPQIEYRTVDTLRGTD